MTEVESSNYLANVHEIIHNYLMSNYGDYPDYLIVHPHKMRLAITSAGYAAIDPYFRLKTFAGVPVIESYSIEENQVIPVKGKPFKAC